MTALEQLPRRLEGVESQLVQMSTRIDGISVQVDDARRETRVLHEDVLARIRLIGEALAVNSEKIATQDGSFVTLSTRVDTLSTRVDALSTRVDTLSTRVDKLSNTVDALSTKVDAARDESKLMFQQVLERLDAPKTTAKRKRH